MKEKLKTFLTDTFLFEFNEDITPETDLFKAGIIDSMGYIQLIQFMEREGEFRFTEDELLSSVLVSLDQMVECVEKKQGSVTP